MIFHTKSDSYFEVRKVNYELFRIFYCEKKNFTGQKKVKEKMITSDDTKKKACKKAKLFQEIYDMGYTDGMGW